MPPRSDNCLSRSKMSVCLLKVTGNSHLCTYKQLSSLWWWKPSHYLSPLQHFRSRPVKYNKRENGICTNTFNFKWGFCCWGGSRKMSHLNRCFFTGNYFISQRLYSLDSEHCQNCQWWIKLLIQFTFNNFIFKKCPTW